MESENLAGGTSSFYSMLLALRDGLQDRGDLLVLAESCTSGLVAAELGQIPGISSFFCGSMVVYRTQSKSDWLGISDEILQNPAIGPVSQQTTVALASAILKKTPEATVAAAITGHLGPDAPKGMDGTIYCALEFRNTKRPREFQGFQLTQPSAAGPNDVEARAARQREAAWLMLNFIASSLHPAGCC